jgi:NAD(P)-dependent dehydrogenase (short-subunit alcohol dehydrogenase family)
MAETEARQRRTAQSISVHCDVRDAAQIGSMVQAALDRFGKIDVLVNNAGVISVAPVVAMTEEQWDLVLDVNVKGTFLCSKAVAPHMMERRSGRIVNLSSQANAVRLGRTTRPSRGDGHQSLAQELGQFNVTVNAVCPGEVDSAMWQDHLLPALAALGGSSKEEAWEQFMKQRVPLGRPQTAEDIGQAVVFLCQADNITGESINVTGGSEMG